MNILITNSTKIFGGGEDYVHTLARHLSRRGHTVFVSANPGHLLLDKCSEDGVSTFPLAYGDHKRILSVAAALRNFIRGHSIDVVHSNAEYDRTASAFGAACTKARHVATVHSSHSIQHNITHWLRNRYAISRFIVVSKPLVDILIREDRIEPERITFIPNGVDSETPAMMARDRNRIRTELGAGPETLVIGNVAQLVRFKGHEYLLRSIADVVRIFPRVLFPVIGSGELMEALVRQTTELGITDHVRFPGFRNDVASFFAAFDIYCHSSIELGEEAFPMAILHALAAGLPVVSTNVGGIAMMVKHGVTGLLTQPQRPADFAVALLTLVENEELRVRMGKAGFELWAQGYSASLMAERVERVYDAVLSKNEPAERKLARVS